MNTHNSNPDESVEHGNHLEDFQSDYVKGEGILGGGKGAVIMPTANEESDSTDDSSIITEIDPNINTGVILDGSVNYNDDGTIAK